MHSMPLIFGRLMSTRTTSGGLRGSSRNASSAGGYTAMHSTPDKGIAKYFSSALAKGWSSSMIAVRIADICRALECLLEGEDQLWRTCAPMSMGAAILHLHQYH